MSKHAVIVVTTIHEPTFIRGYVDDVHRAGREESTELVVIPDRKTPAGVYERCRELDGAMRIHCPDLDEQEAFLGRFPSLEGRLPYDTDHRRNVGFLMALDRGAEVLISIDDDNFCLPGSDFVGTHCVVGSRVEAPRVESASGWLNVCDLLEHDSSAPFFPRGFPYHVRNGATTTREPASGTVAMNVGLWSVDPDVDAVTRLALDPRTAGLVSEPVLLGPGTWSPLNTQNTALKRDAVAAYWYVRMGHPVGGMRIDRFGDILSGYFCAKVVKTLGEEIRIGTPVARHERTPHNLFRDLFHELAGIVIVEELAPWLMEIPLSGSGYAVVYAELADALEAWAPTRSGFVWDDGGRDFLASTAADMRAWVEAVETIG